MLNLVKTQVLKLKNINKNVNNSCLIEITSTLQNIVYIKVLQNKFLFITIIIKIISTWEKEKAWGIEMKNPRVYHAMLRESYMLKNDSENNGSYTK